MKKTILIFAVLSILSAEPTGRPSVNVQRSSGPTYTMTPEGRIFVDGKELTTRDQMSHALNRLIAAMAKYPMCGGSYPPGHKPQPMDIHWQIEDSE